jgi:hypothetical protein
MEYRTCFELARARRSALLAREDVNMKCDPQLEAIRSVLENADNLINQQDADQAIELLNGIGGDIMAYPGSVESFRYSLLCAQAYSAKEQVIAGSYFTEAEDKAARLADLSPELLLRLHEHVGDFYSRSPRTLGLAIAAYGRAKKTGVEYYRKLDVDHLQLKIISAELRQKKDAIQNTNFAKLKKVARCDVYTYTETLLAWNEFIGLERLGGALVARGAKKEMPDEYFRGLLSSIRKRLAETEGAIQQQSLFL